MSRAPAASVTFSDFRDVLPRALIITHACTCHAMSRRAHLVSYDISPTGAINAIFKDNRTVCAQVAFTHAFLFSLYISI